MNAQQVINKLCNTAHIAINGATGEGKTYFTLSLLRCLSGPRLFFNPQDELVKDAIRVDMGTDERLILRALAKGHYVNYVPSGEDDRIAIAELNELVRMVRGRTWLGRGLWFAIDECQDMCAQFNPSLATWIARRGRKYGVKGIFLAQSPADVSKILLKQSQYHVLFRLNSYDEQYLKEHKMPVEAIIKGWQTGGKYSFMVWDSTEHKLSGPFKM